MNTQSGPECAKNTQNVFDTRRMDTPSEWTQNVLNHSELPQSVETTVVENSRIIIIPQMYGHCERASLAKDSKQTHRTVEHANNAPSKHSIHSEWTPNGCTHSE
jgi:hypothetical protein